MDTLVCIKAIVREPPRVRDDESGPVFERSRSGSLILNESDGYAVDEAVLLKKRHGGSVTAVTVGPLAGQDALYAALAKGADAAYRVDAEVNDPLLVARLLAAVARQSRYDLILTGAESYEELASAVGPALAAMLDQPFAGAVTDIEVEDDGGRVRVTKEMGGGFYQSLEMPLPAVLSVQTGICNLSYPPTIKVLQARKQPPRRLSLSALGVESGATSATLIAVTPPERERETELIDGDPPAIAAALLDRIGRALPGR